MNHSDSERIASFLESQGLEPLTRNENADLPAEALAKAGLVIFNTCGVRQMAEDRVYGQVHNLKKANPKIKIVLTGCLANRKDVQRRLKNKVDLFSPINNFELFENFIIENSLKTCLPAGKVVNCKLKISAQKNIELSKENISYLSIKPKLTNAYQAFVPIMTGCNNFCAYCVVPYARGREVSRPAEEIIYEVKNLVKKGYKEITLLGQNVNSYSDGKINFSKLVKKVNAIPGKFWIRFVSNHPKDVSPEMIETVTKCKKVCEAFHLPIQAGNDEVLRKMNRKYTAQEYLILVKKIQAAFKKNKSGVPAVITSDIIVGFPGETKKQFLDSAEIMEKVGYDMVFFGQFSPRPGTPAWNMKDSVSKTEKARREQFLNEILKKTALKNSKKFLNTTVEILIEKESSPRAKLLDSKSLALGKHHIYFGKTRTGKNVKMTISNDCHPELVEGSLIGKIIKVKITKVSIWNLEGEIV